MTHALALIQHGWKHLLALAALVLAFSFAFRSLSPAHAQMGPSISYGSNPYKAFYGEAAQGTTSILTTGSETFIVTGVSSNDGDYLSVQIDGVTVIPVSLLDEKESKNSNNSATYDSYSWAYARGNLFLSGNAHLPVEPGSSLEVHCDTSSSCFYYVEGYFAH